MPRDLEIRLLKEAKMGTQTSKAGLADRREPVRVSLNFMWFQKICKKCFAVRLPNLVGV